MIGFIGMSRNENEEGRVFGLGYVFNDNYHGQGYATEGCRAMLDRAVGALEADRVDTGTAAANEPSCRLLKRLGMKEVERSTASFWKTEDGTPIEFEAISTECFVNTLDPTVEPTPNPTRMWFTKLR